jgi:hypothetical protein
VEVLVLVLVVTVVMPPAPPHPAALGRGAWARFLRCSSVVSLVHASQFAG